MDAATREELRGLCRDEDAFRRALQIFAAHYPGCGQCRQRYRLVFDNAPLGCAISDRDGRIVSANPALAALGGRGVAELEGEPVLDLAAPESRDDLARAYARVWSGELATFRCSSRFRGADGGEVWGEISLDPLLDEEGFPLLVLTMIADVSALRAAEREAGSRQRRLVQAEKMASLGTLISGVAHEINKPNNVIAMNSSRLQQAWRDVRPVLEEYYADNGDFLIGGLRYSGLRERLEDVGGAIVNASARIKHIVHDLLGFGRPEAEDRFDAVDLERVVLDAIDELHEDPEGDAHRLVLELAGNLPRIQGCRRRLTQVVVNLVQNALHAVGTDGGEVRVRTEAVADGVRLTVADDGPGIPAADLDRVRDPFFTTKRDAGGTGLGLWICAYIVDEHAGRLEIDSTPGAGTAVVVGLPVATGPRETA